MGNSDRPTLPPLGGTPEEFEDELEALKNCDAKTIGLVNARNIMRLPFQFGAIVSQHDERFLQQIAGTAAVVGTLDRKVDALRSSMTELIEENRVVRDEVISLEKRVAAQEVIVKQLSETVTAQGTSSSRQEENYRLTRKEIHDLRDEVNRYYGRCEKLLRKLEALPGILDNGGSIPPEKP